MDPRSVPSKPWTNGQNGSGDIADQEPRRAAAATAADTRIKVIRIKTGAMYVAWQVAGDYWKFRVNNGMTIAGTVGGMDEKEFWKAFRKAHRWE